MSTLCTQNTILQLVFIAIPITPILDFPITKVCSRLLSLIMKVCLTLQLGQVVKNVVLHTCAAAIGTILNAPYAQVLK